LQRIHTSPRPYVTFRNRLFFYGEELTPCPNPKTEGHPLLAVHNCLLYVFAATLHFWRPSPPSANQGCSMPCHATVTGTHTAWDDASNADGKFSSKKQ